MFLEVALILPIYILICYTLIRYRHVIKAMSSLDNLLSNIDEGFDDVVDTPEEGVAQRKKRETLKDAIQYGKAHLLPGKKGKWSSAEEIDKKTDEEVEKLYNLYMQRQMQVKGEMTGRAMGSHLINLYFNGVCKVLKIDNIEQLRRDIDEDPIIKELHGRYWGLNGNYLREVVVTHSYCLLIANHTEGFVTSWEEQQLEYQEKDG